MNSQQIRELRKRANISQTDLAQRLGVDASLVSRWEKGEREPSGQQLLEVARALGVTVDFLLNAEVRPAFQLRGSAAKDADGTDDVRRALLDAEQQLHFLQSAYKLADKPLRPPYGLRYDLTNIPAAELPDFVDELRTTLRLNRYVRLDELKQALAENHVHVFTWALPRNMSGLSYRGVFAAIFINHNHPPERQLFTLAHELAHLLFHLRRDEHETAVSLFSSSRDPEERQANEFAAELLMPARLVDESIADRVGDLREPGRLETLARQFNVSRDAMFYRLASRGIFHWSERKQFFATVEDESVQLVPRVSEIDAQVSPEFIQVALGLHDAEQVSDGKLAEWFYTNRPIIESYLSKRYYEAEGLIV